MRGPFFTRPAVLRAGAAASLFASFIAPLAAPAVAQVAINQDQSLSRQAPPAFLREPEQRVMSGFYGSAGMAWSGELGFEFELGVQAQVGALQLRFSPFNISVFSGDERYDGRNLDDADYYYYDDDCYDDYDADYSYYFFCNYEPDSETRSVAEAQLELTQGFFIGGGAAYQMQGTVDPDRSRLSGFLTLASRIDSESVLELRLGEDYSALRVVGYW